MKIGIDLDEVTVNFLEHLLNFYHKKTGKSFRVEDFSSYDLWETLGGTREESRDLIFEFYNSVDFEDVDPIENSLESIKKLLENNEIFIITARPLICKEKTERWMNKYLIEIHPKIIYSGDFDGSGKTKSEICEEIGIDVMIEDSKDYSLACAEKGIKVILFDKPWNQKFEHENVVRVFSWDEVIEEIKKIEKQKL